MKLIRKNWTAACTAFALAMLVVSAIYACFSALGQTAPVLTVTPTGTNTITVVATNGVSNGVYQLYYREDLTTNFPWVLFTNGGTGQTNFAINTGDTIKGYFEAAYNPGFVLPTITIIIQSPTNGALLY